jgi:hypothetical protein
LIIRKDAEEGPDAAEFGFTSGADGDSGWGIYSLTPVAHNAWVHIAATYDRSTGILEAEDIAPYQAASGIHPFWVGADPHHGFSGRDFSGKIME